MNNKIKEFFNTYPIHTFLLIPFYLFFYMQIILKGTKNKPKSSRKIKKEPTQNKPSKYKRRKQN